MLGDTSVQNRYGDREEQLSDQISLAMTGWIIPCVCVCVSVCMCVRERERERVCVCVELTLIKKVLRKAAGSLSLYWLVTSTPPTTVAALLANVNCTNTHKQK